MPAPKEKARPRGRAKVDASKKNRSPAAGPQSPRLPRPDEIKARVSPADFFARELPKAPTLKAGGDGWSQNIACPFHEDPNPSFGLNVETGGFKCFGCDAAGGSILDFVMLRDGLDLAAARGYFAEHWGVAPGERTPARPARRPAKPKAAAPEPLSAIPEEALAERPTRHHKFGAPSASWIYADAEGRALFFVHRFDPAGGRKSFAPQWWTAADGWTWRAPPAPRPLYGLDRLAARPESPVLVAEGEKASDAAGALFPGCVATATANGAQSPGKSDFGPLRGRRVLVWPDADAPGAAFAQTVADLAQIHGAARVAILDLATVARDPASGEPRELPRGWDAADAIADGWTAETIAAAARFDPVAEPESGGESDPEPEPGAEGPPFPFELRESGIYFARPANGGGDPPPPIFVCPPIRVLAVTRDERGAGFGRLVEFRDLDGEPRQEVITDRERQGSGDLLRARLADLGFEVSSHPEARRQFLELLRRWTPPDRARAVSRTGWTEDGAAYVLPDQVIGEPRERVVFASETERPEFREKGTIEGWRAGVGRLCVGNSRLVFAVSLAFAPPLLRIVGAREGGGFHLKGKSSDGSSSGKTTVQRAAASVVGSPETLQRWRTTDNGLESVAEVHSDMILNLDDLNDEITPQAAGAALYMLSGGTGKVRADRSGAGRPVRRWRLLFLSSGEAGLAEHMAAIQRRAKAGQHVRMAEVPADAGAGHGVFDDLHGYPDGGAFAVALADAAGADYGTPFVAFVRAIIAQRAELPGFIKSARAAFVAEALAPFGAVSGQVRRVADRFALVGVAGELATGAGITGWEPGAAKAAALRCFGDWVSAAGGAGPSGERELIAHVRYWLEQHANRFRWRSRGLDDHAPEVPRAAGFKEEDNAGGLTFFCFRETFRREVLEGFDLADAAPVLIRHGILQPDPKDPGHLTQKVRLPGFQHPARVYVLSRERVAGGADGS